MELVHVIRHKVLVEKKSIRAVAKEVGHSRNAVKRYLRGAEPGKRKPAARERPLQDKVAERVEKLLVESPRWTTDKQKLTAKRVEEMLNKGEDGEQALAVGYTLVKEVLRELRRRRAEVFVPLVYRPGNLAEVDFFEVTVDVAGVRKKGFMFVMRLMFSGRDFCRVYPKQDTTCFLDGHARAFEHFGFVPERCLYDNLRAAVRKILVGSERALTVRFMGMATHYDLEACFARPYTGHDKGGVEARGKGIRWAHLVPIPAGPSLLAVSAALMARIDERVDAEKFAEEAKHMRPLPPIAFRAVKTTEGVSISPRSLVKVDGATYSVPCIHARLTATVHGGAFDVELVCPDGERIAHVRQPSNGRSVRYMHYLRELRRKPQAVRQVAHVLVEELGPVYVALWIDLCAEHGEKEAARRFAHVIGEIDDHGLEDVTMRLTDANRRGRLLAPEKAAPIVASTLTVPAALAKHQVETADLSAYDELIGPGARPPARGTAEPVAVDGAKTSWGDADGDGHRTITSVAGGLQ